MKKLFALVMASVAISGCSTFNAQMYGVSPDTNYALKSLKIDESVMVGEFTSSRQNDTSCRAVGPISLPNNLSFQGYIKKAFEDELKIAGVYSSKNPKVVLTGRLNKIDMSSSKNITRGYWDIDLTIYSSNGSSISANEYYEFDSGFEGITACKNTADGLMPAVQNLIGKIVKSPNFKNLATPR